MVCIKLLNLCFLLSLHPTFFFTPSFTNFMSHLVTEMSMFQEIVMQDCDMLYHGPRSVSYIVAV